MLENDLINALLLMVYLMMNPLTGIRLSGVPPKFICWSPQYLRMGLIWRWGPHDGNCMKMKSLGYVLTLCGSGLC